MPRKNKQKSDAVLRKQSHKKAVPKEGKVSQGEPRPGFAADLAAIAGPRAPLGAAYGNALAQASREAARALPGPSQGQDGAAVHVGDPASRRAAKAASQGPRPRGRPMGYRMAKAPCPGCGLPVAVRADDGGPSRKHSCSSKRSVALQAKAERQSAARRADAGAAPVGVVA